MYLIVGLGNPGKPYENTFHNVGFMAIDEFAKKHGATFSKSECKAKTSHIFVDGEKVILAKPQTYMNLSGESVISLTAKYKIPQENFVIVYDDVDLPIGELRIRENGSAGTHNGMRNIVSCVGTQNFARMRVGIKNKNAPHELKDYVLSHVPADDRQALDKVFEGLCDALEMFCHGEPMQKIMQKHNVK